jgi:deoxyribose-phosphate aldolase
MADIDRERLESITREVVKGYLAAKAGPSDAGSAAAPSSAERSGARVLAVVTAARRGWDDARASLVAVGARRPITLLATGSAVKEFGLENLKAIPGVVRVITPDDRVSAAELAKGHEVLVFAALSMNALSRLVAFAADALPYIVAYYFLQTGKPFLASRDGLWCTHFPEPSPGTPAGRRTEEMVNQLKTLGVRVTSARTLGQDVLWACGDAVRTADGPVRVTTGTSGKVGLRPFSTQQPAPPQSPTVRPEPAAPASAKPSGAPASGKQAKPEEHSNSESCPHCREVASIGGEALQALGAERLSVCRPAEHGHRVAFLIDHTLLKSNATQEEVGKLCEEAKRFCFASVCINPAYVSLAAQLLRGSGVKVCTVVGFPLGSTTPTVKSIEARDAMANGADEIDMVINVGALKSGNHALVLDDIRAVREATRGKVLKVIIETAFLTKEEKVKACELSKQAGADFVKTSTGFGPGGATVEDIALMRGVVGPDMGVKASGGIRDQETALKMVEAGATRLGTSASISITTGKKAGEGKY